MDDQAVDLLEHVANRAQADELAVYVDVAGPVKRHHHRAAFELAVDEPRHRLQLEETEVELEVNDVRIGEVESAVESAEPGVPAVYPATHDPALLFGVDRLCLGIGEYLEVDRSRRVLDDVAGVLSDPAARVPGGDHRDPGNL